MFGNVRYAAVITISKGRGPELGPRAVGFRITGEILAEGAVVRT